MSQTEKPKARGPGRPPAGQRADGTPEAISHWPKLTINMHPSHRKRLAVLVALTGRPAWRLIAEGLDLLIDKLPSEQRRVITAIGTRSRRGDPGA
ncbi:MAG: hypothetical protein ACE141_06010 [Bryobacteraceae bacterium]